MSTAPSWLIDGSLTHKRMTPLVVRQILTDPGCMQKNPFEMDITKTIELFTETFARHGDLLDSEAEYFKSTEIPQLIISDISCFGQLLGERLGVPAVCVATFDWAFVYQHVRLEHPEFSAIISRIEEIDKRFEYCLVPGTVCEPLRIGKQRVQFNWDSRKPVLSREEIIARIGIGAPKRLVLHTFGGHVASTLCPSVWKKYADIHFLVLCREQNVEKLADNVHFLWDREWSGLHTSLVDVADVVFGKLGYGTCAEILHCRKPFFCVSRIANPEGDFLEPVMRDAVPMTTITPEQFIAGEWDGLMDLFAPEDKEMVSVETDGEVQVANWVRHYLGDATE